MTDTVPRNTRRSASKALAVSAVAQAGAEAASMPRAAAARDGASRSGMGIVVYDCAIRRKWMRRQDATFDLFEPLTFLKHCAELGAGGMQAPLGVLPPDRVRALRDDAERHELFVEAIVNPPASESDVARFETEVKTAAEVGAPAARTVIVPRRRYEQFKSLEEFQAAKARGRRMLELAARRGAPGTRPRAGSHRDATTKRQDRTGSCSCRRSRASAARTAAGPGST